MAEPKTRKTGASVADYIAAVEPASLRQDSETICNLLRKITGEEPAMWGPSIIGFGEMPNRTTQGVHYWPMAAFSPRKPDLTLYIGGFERYEKLLGKLGPHKIGKSCLYIRRLSAIDLAVLEDILRQSYKEAQQAVDSFQ